MDKSNTSTGQETADTSTEQVTEQVMMKDENGNDVSLDDLMNLTTDDYEEFGEENHKGMKPLHEWMKNVPSDVRKHIANIRSSYTRKTQELAEQKKALEEQSRTLKQQLLTTQELNLNNPMLEQMRGIASQTDELDLYTEEGIQAAIQREAAKMVEKMLAPAQEQMRFELEVKRREMALQDFKSQHPDLLSQEIKLPVAQLLMERPELKLEDAYYIVKAKVEATKAQQIQQEAAAVRSSRKETLTKTSTGTASNPSGTPKFRDAWEAFQYHKAQAAKK